MAGISPRRLSTSRMASETLARIGATWDRSTVAGGRSSAAAASARISGVTRSITSGYRWANSSGGPAWRYTYRALSSNRRASSDATWPAETFELFSVVVTLSGSPNAGVITDSLIYVASDPSNTNYQIIYRFRARTTTVAPTIVTPISYISSGANIKHTDTGNYALNSGYFASGGADSGPLHALANGVNGPNGVHVYGPSAFPSRTFNSSNYWVDVVFAARR